MKIDLMIRQSTARPENAVDPGCTEEELAAYITEWHRLDKAGCRSYVMCVDFNDRHLVLISPQLPSRETAVAYLLEQLRQLILSQPEEKQNENKSQL